MESQGETIEKEYQLGYSSNACRYTFLCNKSRGHSGWLTEVGYRMKRGLIEIEKELEDFQFKFCVFKTNFTEFYVACRVWPDDLL